MSETGRRRWPREIKEPERPVKKCAAASTFDSRNESESCACRNRDRRRHPSAFGPRERVALSSGATHDFTRPPRTAQSAKVILFSLRARSPDPYQISELLAKTIGDAHSRTCLFTGEQIADMLRKPQDDTKFHYYKNMVSARRPGAVALAPFLFITRPFRLVRRLCSLFSISRAGAGGFLARVRPEIDRCHTADHRVCQNGPRIHEAISGRSDCSTEDGY